MTHEDPFLVHLNDVLPLVNDQMEVGFFFEEGGCWGFALALHGLLLARGYPARLAYQTGWMHAYVEVGGAFMDYRGFAHPQDSLALIYVDPSELRRVAIEEAHHLADEVAEHQSFALSVVNEAVSRFGAPSPAPN